MRFFFLLNLSTQITCFKKNRHQVCFSLHCSSKYTKGYQHLLTQQKIINERKKEEEKEEGRGKEGRVRRQTGTGQKRTEEEQAMKVGVYLCVFVCVSVCLEQTLQAMSKLNCFQKDAFQQLQKDWKQIFILPFVSWSFVTLILLLNSEVSKVTFS